MMITYRGYNNPGYEAHQCGYALHTGKQQPPTSRLAGWYPVWKSGARSCTPKVSEMQRRSVTVDFCVRVAALLRPYSSWCHVHGWGSGRPSHELDSDIHPRGSSALTELCAVFPVYLCLAHSSFLPHPLRSRDRRRLLLQRYLPFMSWCLLALNFEKPNTSLFESETHFFSFLKH